MAVQLEVRRLHALVGRLAAGQEDFVEHLLAAPHVAVRNAPRGKLRRIQPGAAEQALQQCARARAPHGDDADAPFA